MKRKEGLAVEHWLDNTNRIYSERLHVSAYIIEAYEAGFEKARALMVSKIREEIGDASLPAVGCDPNMGEEEI